MAISIPGNRTERSMVRFSLSGRPVIQGLIQKQNSENSRPRRPHPIQIGSLFVIVSYMLPIRCMDVIKRYRMHRYKRAYESL